MLILQSIAYAQRNNTPEGYIKNNQKSFKEIPDSDLVVHFDPPATSNEKHLKT